MAWAISRSTPAGSGQAVLVGSNGRQNGAGLFQVSSATSVRRGSSIRRSPAQFTVLIGNNNYISELPTKTAVYRHIYLT